MTNEPMNPIAAVFARIAGGHDEPLTPEAADDILTVLNSVIVRLYDDLKASNYESGALLDLYMHTTSAWLAAMALKRDLVEEQRQEREMEEERAAEATQPLTDTDRAYDAWRDDQWSDR